MTVTEIGVADETEPDAAATASADPEALFREAHRRRRRRRLLGCTVGLVAVALAVCIGVFAGHSTPRRSPPLRPPRLARVRSDAPRPTVDLRALRGQGRLAFVSRGSLWVVDGSAQTLHQVDLPRGLVPLTPTFSPDGRWVAFTTGSTPLMQGALWIAPATGTTARRVGSLVLGDAFGWSPRADLYAFAAGPMSRRAPFFQPTTVRLVAPSGIVRTLVTAPAIVGAAWSPDGSALAVSTMNHDFVPSLRSYAVGDGGRTVWRGAPTTRGTYVVPVGWWPHWGVVYTVIDRGMVPGGEGSFNDAALYALSTPAGSARYLGETLTNDSDGVPTGSSTGDLAFVNDTGFPRTPWDGKQVEMCRAVTHRCSAVPTPPGDVSEDPVWSPSCATLAYVVAPASTSSEFLSDTVDGWYAAHTLSLYEFATGVATSVPAARGVTVPLWSLDGRSLLYEAGDGLWLAPTSSEHPVEVAGPLFSQSAPASYYGEIDWAQQFGWSAGVSGAPCYVACDDAASL